MSPTAVVGVIWIPTEVASSLFSQLVSTSRLTYTCWGEGLAKPLAFLPLLRRALSATCEPPCFCLCLALVCLALRPFRGAAGKTSLTSVFLEVFEEVVLVFLGQV